jgi:hypothetical protein
MELQGLDFDFVDMTEIKLPESEVPELEVADVKTTNKKKQINSNDMGMEDEKIHNNWTEQNIITVRTWKQHLLKSIVIYNYTLEKYKKRLNIVMILAMTFGYINTLLTAIISVLSIISQDYLWIIFGFSVASLVINAFITILNIILKNTEWSKMVTKYSAYLDKLDTCYVTIANLLILPKKMRQDAHIFIKRQNKEYLRITKSVPNVFGSDYATANEKYRKFIEGGEIDYTIEQKYCQRDDKITLV